jgi:RNA polymerase sigma-70 factor (ECF subfamily)
MIAAALFYLDPETAKDIVQETWITVTKAIASFEGRSGLSTWLHRIVVNKAKNHLRKPSREFGIEIEDLLDPDLAARFDSHGTWLAPPEASGQNDVESLIENDDLIDCLEGHINQLSDQQRSAIILYELHQQSAEEVCQILDITISNLRVLVHRARQKIFLMLDHWHESGEC